MREGAIRILYINPIGEFSGACKSLVELLKNREFCAIEPVILCPEGSAADYFRRNQLRVVATGRLSQYDHTRHGRYRGARWLVALRELLLLPGTYFRIRRAVAEAGPVAAIHLNEITGIITGVLVQRFVLCPLVVHVRAHMGEQGRGLRSALLWGLVRKHVAWSICIDETVSATMPASIPRSVVHNSINLDSSEPKPSANWDRVLEVLPPGGLKVAIVGSLLRVKGVYEFVEAAVEICRRRRDIYFLIVGKSVRRTGGVSGGLLRLLGLVHDAEKHCRERIDSENLQANIIMVGHVDDIRLVYGAIDILCFPSHYNASGRPVIEAAFFGKPSIVAIDDPKPDTLIAGVTGIAIPARSTRAITDAIEQLADDSELRAGMGGAARDLAARNCNPSTNASQVLMIYRKVGVLP